MKTEERVIELIDAGVTSLWGNIKDGLLRHVTRCMERGVGKAKEIHGGGAKR